MRAIGFAWRSLVRQPARASLGILGVAAVGALLFDMLLLSEGLIVSMRDLLDRTGYDVRVTATADLPRTSPRMPDARAITAAIARLPNVRSATAIRFADARIDRKGQRPLPATFDGISGASRPWTIVRGRDLQRPGDVVINQSVADAVGVAPGGSLLLRASCRANVEALPAVTLTVVGIASFPFELTGENSMGGLLETLETACGANAADEADVILVRSAGDADATAASISAARPDLRAATNEQMLGRIQEGGFTYFRQISTVLTTVTVSFALLLITVLLTVSVNQRLGEIAALRALGLSARRMVGDVLAESALIVGTGGVLSLPIGVLLARYLDQILKRMPGIPTDIHFFVFEPRALGVHAALLLATALVAALYPMRLVARLPIAATLRNEVIG